jgi:hypothetical protein
VSWDEATRAAASVLEKAEPLMDFDPSAYLDEEDTPELQKALAKVRGGVLKDLWVWDFYRMEASGGPEGLARLEESEPLEVAWAFFRSLTARE